jgi:formylglycine-generating enzyme required for sulfatase activity
MANWAISYRRTSNAFVVVTLLIFVIVVAILVILNQLNENVNSEFIANPTTSDAQNAIEIPTSMPKPTGTNTPTSTHTPDPLQLALTPVTQNAGWIPVERDLDGVTMVLVPAGCFQMGSNDYDDEKPIHEQCFDQPFWIDKYEVTQTQFNRLGGRQENSPRFIGDNRPVENITWFEADAFCELRGVRLPTEAEWEYAARGPEILVYPWGNQWNENNVVWSGNSNGQTAEVGSRPAGVSWVGAYDLSGNVWEWTSSLYEPYPYDAADGREADTGTRTDVQRVLRGGSGYSYSNVLRAPNRDRNFPGYGNYSLGFRCARSS